MNLIVKEWTYAFLSFDKNACFIKHTHFVDCLSSYRSEACVFGAASAAHFYFKGGELCLQQNKIKNFVLRRQKQSTKSIERMHRNNT